ncbi:MAG: YIP1 family protein [Pseudomonadota bacterium]
MDVGTAPFRPFWQVWHQPGVVIARVAHENPWYRCLAWPVLAGLATWPGLVVTHGYFDASLGWAWSLVLGWSVLPEVAWTFTFAWLLYLTSGNFRGRAGLPAIVTAVAWSHLPIALLAIINVPLWIVGEAAFGPDRASPERLLLGLFFLFAIGIVVASWWLLLAGLAAIQGYSARTALVHVVTVCALPLALGLVVMLAQSGSAAVLDWLFHDSDLLVGSVEGQPA